MGNETISRTTFVKGLTAGVVVVASLGILSAGEYSINGLPTIGEGNGSYTPGTYTASAPGISSDVTVTCTFNETTITSIEADVSGETAGIGADIGDTMVARVLENQVAEVDGESGATITSDAFKAAVAACIAQASGETTAAAEDSSEAETEAAEAETEEGAEEEAAAEASAAPLSYVPGTYTAASAGISSDVTVTVTFDENGITDITVDVSGETAGIGADIGDTVIEQAMTAQSAAIDGVAGATITSDAFKAALEDCIAQASGGADASAEAAADEAEEASSEAVEAETEEGASGEADVTGSYTPGTYTAASAGISSDVTVTATFDESGITEITADVSGETAGIGAEIGDTVIEQAMTAQSAAIDGVAGATITSDAFKAALEDCIAQASGGTDTSAEAETEEASSETEEASEAAADETEEETTEVVETETEEASSEAEEASEAAADETEEEATEAAEAETGEASSEAAGFSFTPGTYTASAAGMESDVTVTITFNDTKMTAVGVYVGGETEGIGAAIGNEVASQILNAQSAEIDGVSGASVTSGAVKEAATSCIQQAREATASVDPAEDAAEEDSQAQDETGLGEDVYLYKGEIDEDTQAEDAPFIPGTYTASAAGISSDVTVEVTFNEARIVSVTADVSGETPNIGGQINVDVARQILVAQSADVDGISGATITSDAIKAAVADCIAQAKAAEDTEAES